jgi:hypothetical protein
MSESETLTEIKKLRSDLESALHMKFDETLFSRENDDIPRSVRALGGAVMRLEDNITKFAPQYVRTPDRHGDEWSALHMEAEGLMAISRLLLAWSIAHESEGLIHRVKDEIIPRVEQLLKKIDAT